MSVWGKGLVSVLIVQLAVTQNRKRDIRNEDTQYPQ